MPIVPGEAVAAGASMTSKTKGPAAVTAEPLESAGNLERTDGNKYSDSRHCSQTNEGGTGPESLFPSLEFVGAFGSLSYTGVSA